MSINQENPLFCRKYVAEIFYRVGDKLRVIENERPFGFKCTRILMEFFDFGYNLKDFAEL